MLTATQSRPISEMMISTELMAHQKAAADKLKGLRVGGLFAGQPYSKAWESVDG